MPWTGVGGVCICFRVKHDVTRPAWVGWMRVATRPRSMSPPSTRTPVAFTRNMSPRTQPPSIVGTLLVRVLPPRPRPATAPASRQRVRVPHAMDGRWWCLHMFSRKTRRDPACLGGMDARCHPATFHVPAIDQDTRRFYAEHVPTHPTPVHSRDAACPRPATAPASCHRARVLPPRPRPACHGRALVVFAYVFA